MCGCAIPEIKFELSDMWELDAERVDFLQSYTQQRPFDSLTSIVGLLELNHPADSAVEE
jgi:hypothetical protein